MLEAVFFEIFLKELCKKKKFRGMISFFNFLWLLKQMFVFVLGFFGVSQTKSADRGSVSGYLLGISCGRRLSVNSLKKSTQKQAKSL